MPKFLVDVKAFISIEVEAPNSEAAIREAEALVHSCDPTDPFIRGWNHTNRGAGKQEQILSSGGFSIDGLSDVEHLVEETTE